MELILEMTEKQESGTEGINYFIVDLVVTLLSWSASAIPEVNLILSDYFQSLRGNCIIV